jgi:hypothetical protein
MIGLGFHIPKAAFYAILASSIFLLSHLLRIFKHRYTTATLTPLPSSNSVIITIPSLRSGWRAGQHVFIRVPGMRELGGVSWMESHPFSIASASSGMTGEGVVLIVKKQGSWTRGLFDFAMRGEDNRERVGKEGMELDEIERSREKRQMRECRIIVDGPYVSSGKHIRQLSAKVSSRAGLDR